MPCALLLITHHEIGASQLQAATDILGDLGPGVASMAIKPSDYPPHRYRDARRLCRELHRAAQSGEEDGAEADKGLLILTDAWGATPGNIAQRLWRKAPIKPISLVAGLNLPMLLRICHYRHLPAAELADAALSGGQRGVMLAPTFSAKA